MLPYQVLLTRKLHELPQQVEILLKKYQLLADYKERKEKISELTKYEKRMQAGIQFLCSINDQSVIANIEKVRNRSSSLLLENKNRYLHALSEYRQINNLVISNNQIHTCMEQLKASNLVHTTKEPEVLKQSGLVPSVSLWLTENKSCANAMDIALGLDECIFFTHGFNLANFGDSSVTVNNSWVDNENTVVTSLDLFTFVLIKTGRAAPTAIATQEWIVALNDYVKNIFAGSDFWQIKAEYILSFFSTIDEFNEFAKENFYSNKINKSPVGEYPFLGEIKVFNTPPIAVIT